MVRNRYDVGANANYRKVPFVGGFLNGPDQPVIPVNQQDKYLFVTALN